MAPSLRLMREENYAADSRVYRRFMLGGRHLSERSPLPLVGEVAPQARVRGSVPRRWSVCSRRPLRISQPAPDVVARFPSPQPSPASGRGGPAVAPQKRVRWRLSPLPRVGEVAPQARVRGCVRRRTSVFPLSVAPRQPTDIGRCRTLPLTPTLSRKRERGNSVRAAGAGEGKRAEGLVAIGIDPAHDQARESQESSVCSPYVIMVPSRSH